MTMLRSIPAPSRPAALPPAQLRWSCSVGDGLLPRTAEFVIDLQPLDPEQIMIEARLESQREPARVVLDQQRADVLVLREAGLMHLDVCCGGHRHLMVTMTQEGVLLYARTPLLARAGLGGGSYDRAVLRVGRAAPLGATV